MHIHQAKRLHEFLFEAFIKCAATTELTTTSLIVKKKKFSFYVV